MKVRTASHLQLAPAAFQGTRDPGTRQPCTWTPACHAVPVCSEIMSVFKRILGSIPAYSELHGLLSRSEARRVMIAPRLPKPPSKRGAGGGRRSARLGQTTDSCMVNYGSLPLSPSLFKISALAIKDKKFFRVIRDC